MVCPLCFPRVLAASLQSSARTAGRVTWLGEEGSAATPDTTRASGIGARCRRAVGTQAASGWLVPESAMGCSFRHLAPSDGQQHDEDDRDCDVGVERNSGI